MKTWIIVIVLALVALVVWKETSRDGQPLMQFRGELRNTQPAGSALYAQEQEFIDRFNADPALRERFAGTFTSKGLYAELTGALRRGANSLDGPLLVRATTSMAAMIPRLPPHSCAKLIRPKDDFDLALSNDIDAALARLPLKHHRNLWEFYLQALKAEVDNAPVRPRNREAEAIAMQHLGSNYQGQFAQRLAGVLANPQAAPDEDACWAINTLTHGSTQLDPQSAEAMARVIWAGPAS